MPGADAGGISMTENGHITSRSPTNEDVLGACSRRVCDGWCGRGASRLTVYITPG